MIDHAFSDLRFNQAIPLHSATTRTTPQGAGRGAYSQWFMLRPGGAFPGPVGHSPAAIKCTEYACVANLAFSICSSAETF